VILDGHIHIAPGRVDSADFLRQTRAAEVEGGVLISLPPASMVREGTIFAPEARLDNLLAWCEAGPGFQPFYWLDPTEDNAIGQVALAVDRGVMGFKVICDHFAPNHPRALEVFRAIACTKRPVLFHCGILWDGKPSSANSRPVGFEELLQVDGLRFALAHIGWPWCDELLAVYGKLLNAAARRPQAPEMFIDITPGTPPIYRREALTKLFGIGYDVQDNVIFGSDCNTAAYNSEWVREWVARDRAILEELEQPAAVANKVFGANLERFLGLRPGPQRKVFPRVAQS